MAFTDAISVNRITHSNNSFDAASRKKRAFREWSQRVKMSVNISSDTVYKIARQKLSDAVEAKLSYNRLGVYESKRSAGQIFSVKA